VASGNPGAVFLTLKMTQKYHFSLYRVNVFLMYETAINRVVNPKTEAGVDTYLTAKEVALLLKCSLQTVRRYTMNKEIPFHKLDRAVRYKKSEIELWFEKRQAEKTKAKTENKNLDGGLFNETDTGGKL
jgi:excisionase family DNA binding protein